MKRSTKKGGVRRSLSSSKKSNGERRTRRRTRELSRRDRRGRRATATRRIGATCSPLTHTFTRPLHENWPEPRVWEY